MNCPPFRRQLSKARPRWVSTLAVLLTLAMAVAACGGSEGSDDSSPDDSSTQSPSSDGTGDSANADGDSDSGSDFYVGKDIEYVIPVSPGGAAQVTAELNARWFRQYLEGDPSIQVVNMPGAGGQLALTDYMLRKEPNGETILLSTATSMLPFILRDPSLQYDAREMHPVLGIPTGGVAYVSPDTGVESISDLPNATTQLVSGEQAVDGLAMLFLIAWELLEVDVEVVAGYEGTGPKRIAFEQGETNLDWQTTNAYNSNVTPLVDEGNAIPLFTAGAMQRGEVVRDPAFPDMPTVKEAYVELHGEEPSGEAWEAYKAILGSGFALTFTTWVHADAPAEAIAALEGAAQEMADDPEFQSEVVETLGYEPLVGDDLEDQVESNFNMDPAIREWIVNFLIEEHGLERDDS